LRKAEVPGSKLVFKDGLSVDARTNGKVYLPSYGCTADLAKIHKCITGRLTSWQNALREVSKSTFENKRWNLPLEKVNTSELKTKYHTPKEEI
jgi:hypothetical protein